MNLLYSGGKVSYPIRCRITRLHRTIPIKIGIMRTKKQNFVVETIHLDDVFVLLLSLLTTPCVCKETSIY